MEPLNTTTFGPYGTLITPFKSAELSAKNCETPCFKLNPLCYELNENLSNPSSPLTSSFVIKSPLISSNPHLDIGRDDDMDHKSPTKRSRTPSARLSKLSEPLLTETSTPTHSSMGFDLPEVEFVHLHLEPIQCDLNPPLTEDSQSVPLLVFSPHTPTPTKFSDEEEGEEKLDEAPSSPTQKRLSPSRNTTASMASKPSQDVHQHEIPQEQRLRPPTVLSSIQPLFERPLYHKRSNISSHVQTLSRIPKPPERTLPSSAAPGIRMPDSMHLDYATKERPGPFVTRLDLKRDAEPRCSAYLTSPYPRLTKSAVHTVEFYEQRLAESAEILIIQQAPKPIKTPSKYRMIHFTPPKSQQKRPEPPTCMSTGLGKRSLSRKATVPVSPKLATAARNRKCQCCTNGIHGGKPLQAGAQTTVGKRQNSLRRRPSPGPVTGRSKSRLTTPVPTPVATPSAASFKTPGKANLHVRFGPLSYDDIDEEIHANGVQDNNSKHFHASMHTPTKATSSGKVLTSAMKKSAPASGSCAAASSSASTASSSCFQLTPSASATKKPKPVLNLTTSLPEFKQPLASLIESSTPGPSREEVNAKLKTPLPVYVAPPAPRHAHTPVRLPSLEEALGPNFHLVRAYTSSHPFAQPFAMDPQDNSVTPLKDKASR